MPHLFHALVLALAPFLQDPKPAAPPAPELDACEELAGEIEYAISEGEVSDLEPFVDCDALLQKATAGVEVDEQFRKGFIEGAREKLVSTFHASMQQSLGEEGALRFLRLRPQPGGQRLVFRALTQDGGVDYIEFSTHLGAEGKPRIDDWYLYASGEWISETLHRLYLPFAMQQQRGLLDRLLGRDQVLVKHWGEIAKLIECVQKRQLEPGLAIYRKLPEELRHEKFVLLLRLRLLTTNNQHEDYLHVLEDLRRYCPGDPANELHAIDFHYIRKEWNGAVEAVRRLAASVGGDPYLDYLEATLLVQAKDTSGARRAVEKSLAAEPDRIEAHWLLVTLCLGAKDHGAVLSALKRIDELFVLEWKDLSASAEYKDFVASVEHAKWLEYLAAKPKK